MKRRNKILFGIILTIIGGHQVLKNIFGIDMFSILFKQIPWENFWPIAMLSVGVYLLIDSYNKK